MSAFYTTKALGREWLPTPNRSNKPGRYGSWPPLNSQKLRQSQDTAPPLWHKSWSKVHERFALAVIVLLTLWLFSDSLRRGIHLTIPHQIHPSHLNLHLPLPWPTHDSTPTSDLPSLIFPNATWSDFAYMTYATDLANLCSSLQLLSTLQTLDVKPDRVLLYPSSIWNITDPDPQNTAARLLRQARDTYHAQLIPIGPLFHPITPSGSTWQNSFTKLLAFNQTQYLRILTLDSDSTLLKPLDHLFLLPAAVEIAMPKAYWLPQGNDFMMPATPKLCSSLILLKPSDANFGIVEWYIEHRGIEDYDMEIMNRLFYSAASDEAAVVLPHRGYVLLTGEFREENHEAYLELGRGGGGSAAWSPKREVQEAFYVHFSDHPLPKPWGRQALGLIRAMRPRGREEGEVWDWLYRDFRERRVKVCGEEFGSWVGVDEVEGDVEGQKVGGGIEMGTSTMEAQSSVVEGNDGVVVETEVVVAGAS